MDRIERETLSSATIKTDNGSKILPGDKSGLPCEVWAIIFSYLQAEDLCRCAIVCKTWNDLILCLDHTKWKDLYLQCTSWRQPNWPLNLHSEPFSWRQAYKEKYIQSHFWTQVDRSESSVTCMSVFRRQKARKTITVGIGKEHPSLKSALTVANDYDRILVYPGIYDEQFEMSSKIPFELIGVGELGSVILVVCIEQTAITGHISNLVFRAPWFTNFILKVRSGYLQVDNCIMEDGMVYVQNPGSISAHFCTFRHATLILQHVTASIIQNCEFSQTDSAAITVEGYPKDEKNWTYQSMLTKMMSLCRLQQPERLKSGETMHKSAFSTVFSLSTATVHKKSQNRKKWDDLESKASEIRHVSERKQSYDFDMESHDIETHSCNASLITKSDLHHGAVGGVEESDITKDNPSIHVVEDSDAGNQSFLSLSLPHSSSEIVIEDNTEYREPGSKSFIKLPDIFESQMEASMTSNSESIPEIKSKRDKLNQIHSFVSDCAKYSNSSADHHDDVIKQTGHHNHSSNESNQGVPSLSDHATGSSKTSVNERKMSVNKVDQSEESDNEANDIEIPSLDLHSLGSNANLNNVDNQNNRGDAADNASQNDGSSSTSTMSMQSASSDDTDEEEQGRGRAYGSDASTSSSEDSLPVSDNESEFSSSEESVIMLQCPERHQPRSLSAQKDYNDVMSINSQNQSEHIDIIEDVDMKKILNNVRGCFIHKCRITQCKGGVMVSLQAHAIILESEINSVGYGIRCIQNSKTVILKNEIHHCRTSGVFMRLAATGLVTVFEVDRRKFLSFGKGLKNEIHHCRTSGVFMRLAATGLVTGNDIHSNNEAGVDIRKNADPVVQCNRIHHGKRSGVVILGSGRGQIKHNDIYQNKEAGVYILYRGNPVVSIVILGSGRGQIKHNDIYQNKEAGVYILYRGNPVVSVVILGSGRGQIKHNDIYQNKEAGVYILYRGNPVVSHNQIYSGKAAGIAVNEGGRGYIHDNTITGNQWGGIDIRHGGDPLIYHNTVCNGISDGIVIGEEGRGSIENNIITGNAGCGVWIMAAHQPLIHGNEIHSNRDSGISLVNKMDTTHKNETMAVDTKDTQSQHSQEFWNLVSNDDNQRKKRLVTMATVEYNKVYHNDGCGMSIQFGEGVIVDSNYLFANKSKGIFVDQPFPVAIKNNSISCNHDNGIQATCEEKVEICGNGIYDNQGEGLLYQGQGQTDITENDILGNKSNGIVVRNTELTKIKNNRIYSQTGFGVFLTDTQFCEVENNTFYMKNERTVYTEDGSQCSVMNNQLCPVPSCSEIQSTGQGHQDLSLLESSRWHLVDPKSRPHIDFPTNHIPYRLTNHVTTITKVTIPAENCEQGSKFCVIL